ncbi:hypothetical protein ASH00_14675 [Arthrobacter sp. Soil782]|uniref:hypothetical protein n=1 Tax=Arthrobacter sp. Soil782 TaxID=1736410 RepID=UPI0006FFFE14|nr:hypothetical protein [Arthrobacter sp. Soil782]KRF04345.1 hypothetical protein ASH00_14675 [Arthrobacter sp. Soil782]
MASEQHEQFTSLKDALSKAIEQQVQHWEDMSWHHDEGQESYDEKTDLDYVKAAMLLPDIVEELTLEVARKAHTNGYTWGQIAAAANLSSAQIAHHRWAEGREQRLESLKKRVGGRRPSMATPDVPGRSAAEAARLLGCDPRTLPARVAAGEIQMQKVTLNSGTVRTRYFLPGDPLPA